MHEKKEKGCREGGLGGRGIRQVAIICPLPTNHGAHQRARETESDALSLVPRSCTAVRMNVLDMIQ